MPEGAYKITVVSPAKWQKDKATAKINIVDVNGTGWANIRIVVATENGWQTVVDGDDQSAGYAVELREKRDDPCVHYRPCGQCAGEKRSDFLL